MSQRVNNWFQNIGKDKYIGHLDWSERQKIGMEVYKQLLFHPAMRWANRVVITLAMLIIYIFIFHDSYSHSIIGWIWLPIIGAIVFQHLSLWYVHLRVRTPILQQYCYMNNIRPLICFSCKYDLQYIVSPACPECGVPVEPNESAYRIYLWKHLPQRFWLIAAKLFLQDLLIAAVFVAIGFSGMDYFHLRHTPKWIEQRNWYNLMTYQTLGSDQFNSDESLEAMMSLLDISPTDAHYFHLSRVFESVNDREKLSNKLYEVVRSPDRTVVAKTNAIKYIPYDYEYSEQYYSALIACLADSAMRDDIKTKIYSSERSLTSVHIQELIQLLEHDDPETVLETIYILARLSRQYPASLAVPALQKLVKSNHPHATEAALLVKLLEQKTIENVE